MITGESTDWSGHDRQAENVVMAPASCTGASDGSKTSRDCRRRDAGLGVSIADLDTLELKSRSTIDLTFHWSDPDRWEGTNFPVSVV